MNQNRKTTIILAGFILAILVVCGAVGYLNDSGRTSPTSGETDNTTPTNTPNAIDLIYCTSPVSLCIISFGQDNAGNMLIVIRNKISGLAEFYAKLTSTDASEFYPCQKVQFAPDVYYCMGSQIPDGTMVTMEVYSKNDDHLVASGRIPVSVEATPAPVTPTEPTVTTATSTEPTATAAFSVTQTVEPTFTTVPPATQITPAYPYP